MPIVGDGNMPGCYWEADFQAYDIVYLSA